ncbi:uncharacterized protein SPSK_06658 [Sporothrix schenckii 1099-18]|uniref:Uncharacterized protein n=1 Tax=Sporothrix schenckii 1099-18 TaxID=1397361 RepID=A0A0F2MLX0_SPOSC|nr:uncharacterized protein SPSK_06658 [Sporothrix schenckii 1099-18]KJR90029.1 hypothetical protein SPSK_06658 [Sporothrix schenckii 1099-18]
MLLHAPANPTPSYLFGFRFPIYVHGVRLTLISIISFLFPDSVRTWYDPKPATERRAKRGATGIYAVAAVPDLEAASTAHSTTSPTTPATANYDSPDGFRDFLAGTALVVLQLCELEVAITVFVLVLCFEMAVRNAVLWWHGGTQSLKRRPWIDWFNGFCIYIIAVARILAMAEPTVICKYDKSCHDGV